MSLNLQSYFGVSGPASSCVSRRMWLAERSSDTSEHLDGTSSLYLSTWTEPQGYDSASKVDIWMSTVCSRCLHSHTEQRPRSEFVYTQTPKGLWNSQEHLCGAGRSQSGWAEPLPASLSCAGFLHCCSQPDTSAGGVSIEESQSGAGSPGWHLISHTPQAQPGTDGGSTAKQALSVQVAARWNDSLVPLFDRPSWEIKESQDGSARVEGRSITIPFNLRAGSSRDQETPSSSEHLLLLLLIWVWRANCS